MNKKETLSILLNTLRGIAGETTCMICYEEFDSFEKKPMMICLQQHNCCEECLIPLLRCPLCRTDVAKRYIAKNRLMCSLLEQIERFQRKIDLQQKLCALKDERQNFHKKASSTQVIVSEPEPEAKKMKRFQIRKIQTAMGSRNKNNNISCSLLIGR